MPSQSSESSPLMVGVDHQPKLRSRSHPSFNCKNILLCVVFVTVVCAMVLLFLLLQNTNYSITNKHTTTNSPYTKVQTLSFQIYTGGAPALLSIDEVTGKKKKNNECRGLHSYGLPEDSNTIQCYLGLEDTSKDVEKRLEIMRKAVERAYEESNTDETTLKIFLVPEFYFRGLNGAYTFQTEEAEEEESSCSSDICHILEGLASIVADVRFENWLFLFGTVIAQSSTVESGFDYQFYNFAPLYKGFDPSTSKGIGKKFIVPKRYVSNADFLTPMRDLNNRTMVLEVLEEADHPGEQTVFNPHANGIKKYHNELWTKYKDEISDMGYNMIEYGWFYIDGIAFSVEICLDHLVHRALQTYNANVVTGDKVKIPSSANDSIEFVSIPKHQAQISLVSSAGMDITVESLALANSGYIFLQDGMEGNVEPRVSYGEDECQPNQYEFAGGSQCVKRTAVVSATDVTFEYEMNMDYHDVDVFGSNWKDVLEGVFSTVVYEPKLTVYDPVPITLPPSNR